VPQVKESIPEAILQFGLAGMEFTASKATTSQMALVVAAMDDGGAPAVAAVFRFLRGILHDDGYQRLRDLVAAGVVSFDLLIGGDEDNEDGIVDWLIEKSADERPTKRPTDYLPSQASGGQRSTGRSPGKGSKPSGLVPVAS
jgi:hypothetical protein